MNTQAYTFQLIPEDNHRLANLCGPFDQHLRQIEQKLNVCIYNRGHDFQINGPNNAVEIAAKVLHHLYAETGTKKTTLTSNTIHLVLQNAQTNPNMALKPPKIPGIVIQTKRGTIKPHSPNQSLYIDRILNHDINFGLGPAGTGKTYLAVACAVAALEKEQISRVVLVRPAVEAGEKLGFLPGDYSQKLDPYFRPLYDALNDMLGFELVMQLAEQHIIEVVPLAYMRGRTLNDAFIILDEAQNTTKEQMKMFLTRIGFNSKVVVSGDTTQTDLPRGTESGLRHCLNILKNIKGISFTEFQMQDIVRHTLVQAILQAYAQNENQKKHIKITIQTLASNTFIPSRYFLQRWVKKALFKRVTSNQVNIRLVSKKESAELNSIYRHKKGPTNILSFPFEPPPGTSSTFLGDLVVCAALVNQQAKQQAKTRLAHWAHLIIHGSLHLIGYDHIHDKDTNKMETLEIQLLKELGYENPYIWR